MKKYFEFYIENKPCKNDKNKKKQTIKQKKSE